MIRVLGTSRADPRVQRATSSRLKLSVALGIVAVSLIALDGALVTASADDAPAGSYGTIATSLTEGAGSSYAIQRFPENPIVRPEMLPGSDGSNITGPSLIEVPNWVPNRLGRYYLYFAAHHGNYIRMAYADQLQGPWIVYTPGVLTLEQVKQEAEKETVATPKQGTPHIASPDVHVDHVSQKIRMYFHAEPVDPYIDWLHETGIAVSDDGLSFSLEVPRPVGEPYLRVFQYGSYYYGVTTRAHLQRSIDGVNWEPTVNANFVGSAYDPVTGAEPRHSAVKLDGDLLSVFYTRVGDAPERVMVSTVTLAGDWLNWRLGPPTTVLTPEMDYEGADLPIVQSKGGPCDEAENALRDPAIYREADRVFFLYACKCELGGIAIGELNLTDEFPTSVDLSVSQSDLPDPASVGGTVTYRASVVNASASDARYVAFVDQLPVNSTFVSAVPGQGQCFRSGRTVTCLLGTVAANSTVMVDVVVKAAGAGTMTNEAGVSGDDTDPNPSNNSVSESTTVDPALLLPSLYVADSVVLEGVSGTSAASFMVSLSNPPGPGQTVSVKYSTANGSAVGGSDYVQVPLTTLVFAAGEISRTVLVTVNGDTRAEGNETFTLKLSNPIGAVIADNQATGTIIDEEGSIAVYIRDTAVLEGTSGTATAAFTVSLSSPPGPGQTVSIKYATTNGSALSGSDYVALPATSLSFGEGESFKTVTVAVSGDNRVEGNETFVVKLSNPVGVVIADSQATGTIIDDEGSPSAPATTLYISDATVLEGTSGTTTARFTVWLSNAPGPGQTVSVKYKTVNGSALSGADYLAVPLTTLSFTAGESSKAVTVAVNGDAIGEGNETFTVKLSNPAGVVIGDNQATATMIDEEGPITAYISEAAVLEGSSGTAAARFTVSLSSPPTLGQSVSLKYTTANGSAQSGSDYVAVPLTSLSFGNGESSKTVTVLVNGDTSAEANENFLVKLSNPAGVVIADSQGKGTIVDDE